MYIPNACYIVLMRKKKVKIWKLFNFPNKTKIMKFKFENIMVAFIYIMYVCIVYPMHLETEKPCTATNSKLVSCKQISISS